MEINILENSPEISKYSKYNDDYTENLNNILNENEADKCK